MADFDDNLAQEFIEWGKAVASPAGILETDLTLEKCGAVHTRIAQAIECHTPATIEEAILYAVYVLKFLISPQEELQRWPQAEQEEAIAQFLKASRQLKASLREMNGPVRSELMQHEEYHALVKLLNRSEGKVASARAVASSGLPAGRRNWKAIGVAHICGAIWFTASGDQPPKSADASAPGPFGKFLEAVLAVAEIQSSARSAMRAMPDTMPDQLLAELFWVGKAKPQ